MRFNINKLLASIFTCLLIIQPLSVMAFHSHSQLPPSVFTLMKKYNVPRDSLSVYIIDLDHDHPMLALNPDTPRNPASTIKLVTTLAGLELLGPTYTWESRFYLDGRLHNGKLDGNLVFQGGGDPFLTREYFWHMLHQLHARGLKDIYGDLIIDDSLFKDQPDASGDFDNRPYAVYNTIPDAAMVNFQAQEFVILPQGNNVLVFADPPAANLQIRNNLKLISGHCNSSDAGVNFHVQHEGDNTIAEFSGKYPAACGEQTLLRSIIPIDQYIYGVFKALWQEMGGTITGSYRNATIPVSDKPFYLQVSQPLTEVITNINKFSNNLMARQLLLTIGQIKKGAPGTRDSGIHAIKEWLNSIGISAPELVMDNGAGLSRDTRVSVKTMAEMLEHAWHSPLQPEFMSTLPLAGVDGTMRKRLRGKIEEGSIRIKTGLLNGARAMAGYVTSVNERHYVVVSIQNYPGIQNTTGTLIQDEILKWLYNQ